jgi:Putative quorum-sensing-regulated virulence factor
MKNDSVMPFGKYKGQPIATVPRGYLRWLKENVDLHGWLARAVDCALRGLPIPEPEEDMDTRVHRIVKPWSPGDGEVESI